MKAGRRSGEHPALPQAGGRTPSAAPMRFFFHATCGTELGAYGRCTACGNIGVPLEDVEMRPGTGLDPEPDDHVSRALLAPRRLLQPLDTDRV
ncbi:hypothetical protein ACH4MM_31355 [Streptomyces pratensis]|uniref:hypothetical protein n=1 Tax=Streptomyces pratensis TaxID=1169025 RepID=UPI003791869F